MGCRHHWDSYDEAEYDDRLVVTETCGRCGVRACVEVRRVAGETKFTIYAAGADGGQGDEAAEDRARHRFGELARSLGLEAPQLPATLGALRPGKQSRRAARRAARRG